MELLAATIILAQVALIVAAIIFIVKYSAFALSQGYDVPLVETPRTYLPIIADALSIRADDVVYDLGSGDGRVVLSLARRFPSARFIGIERNPLLIAYSRFKGRNQQNATFIRANFFDAGVSDATRIYAYLKTKPLNQLYENGKFKKVRLVSRAFRIHNLSPLLSVQLSPTPGSHGEHMLYVYEL